MLMYDASNDVCVLSGFYEELVFPSNTGGKTERISKTFADVVEELGINTGITYRFNINSKSLS